MQKDKIDSLLGFAVKAGKLLYGCDTLESVRKPVYLIIVCQTLADNTRKRVLAVAERKNIPVAQSTNALENAVGRQNCKVISVTDKQMAKAMRGYMGQNYSLIRSEVM